MLTRTPSVGISRSPCLSRRVHATIGARPGLRLIRPAVADVQSSAESSVDDYSPSDFGGEEEKRIFPEYLTKDTVQGALSSIPQAIFYPLLVALAGAAGFAGFTATRGSMPADTERQTKEITAVCFAVIAGAAAVAVAMQAKKVRDSASVVDLYNEIVDLPDPSMLTEHAVSGVSAKYGISMQKAELDGLQRIYSQYLESLIPAEEKQLRGDEAGKLISFMSALGLADEEAAPMHVELGKRLYRQKQETKDRFQQFEQRKAFQRLLYVSNLVFGDEKASFLLPWRRIFNLTDAHMHVARRDNAKAIFRGHLEQRGGEIPADRTFLRDLRDYQLTIKVMDESVTELMKEYTRKHIEARLEKCIEVVKSRNKDVAGLCEEVRHVIDYSHKMVHFADEEGLIPGLGRPTVEGGPLNDSVTGKTKELREVFKMYIGERLDNLGEFTQALHNDVNEFQAILCLSPTEAAALREEMSAKLYKRLLREMVVSRRIDAAGSPADVLKGLCDKVRFSPIAATEMHLVLYKQKLAAILSIKRQFNESDSADLARMRRVLCLSEDVVRRAQRDTVAKELQGVVSDIFMLGAERIPEAELARLDAMVQDLQIDPIIVVETLKQATIEKFRGYVQAAMKPGQDRKVAPNVMKKLVQFNALVVTPLMERAKAYASGAPVAPSAQSGPSDEEPQGQSELTLAKEVEPAVRYSLYKKYLSYNLDGSSARSGGQSEKQSQKKPRGAERQAELDRLSHLGVLIGLTKADIDAVHEDCAQDAYKEEVKDIMRAGQLTDRTNYLEDLRATLGVNPDLVNKLQKEVREEMSGKGAMSEDTSKWTLERVMKLHASGGIVENVMEEPARRNMYRKELEARISDGTGELDSEYILEKLPSVLMLEKRKVDSTLKELVGTRRRTLLVQAVSQLRQKQRSAAIVSMNNLISCNRALPEKEPMPWTEPQELKDLFQTYCEKVDNDSRRSLLQAVLGISDDEAAVLKMPKEAAAGAAAAVVTNEDDDGFF